jgi:uncharacterized protein YkwD
VCDFSKLLAAYFRGCHAVSLTALSILITLPSPGLSAEQTSVEKAPSVSTVPSSDSMQASEPASDTSSNPASSAVSSPIPEKLSTVKAAATAEKSSANKATPTVPALGSAATSATSSSGNQSAPKPTAQKPVLKAETATLAPPLKPKIDTSESFSTNPKNSGNKPGTGSGGTKAAPPVSPIGSAPAKPPDGTPVEENYPVIGTLETSVLGAPDPSQPVEARLAKLETAVFRQTFPNLSLFDRTEKLKVTLIGVQQPIDLSPDSLVNRSQMIDSGSMQMQNYYDEISAKPENQAVVSNEEAAKFFIELINSERQKFGFSALSNDEVASNVARAHIEELSKRGLITHADLRGNNPDRRYTTAGGTDLMFESLVSFKADTPDTRKLTRSSVAQLVKTVFQRQDERDALLSSDATALGFAMSIDADRDRYISCCDVITHHGVIQPIPFDCRVGDKIEVKGVVMEPYKFERVTLAWEAKNNNLAKVADEAEEALPYFAPLDYGAYAKNSDKDYSQALGTLRTIAIIAAIAGGVFIPPVALAAPMIAMSGGMGSGEPKPVSDIPIKGGMHVDGNYFSGKIPINHEGKEGLYYVTVWATVTKYGKPIPISRRAILASGTVEANSETVSAKQIKDGSDPSGKKKNKHKKKEDPGNTQGLAPTTTFTPPNQVQNQSGI